MKDRLSVLSKVVPFIYEIAVILTSVAAGLLLGCLVAWCVGEEPFNVIKIIWDGAFGTPYDVGMVIYFMSILIATGLSVAIPFHCGKFNIGAEGQTLMGAFAAGLVGVYAPDHIPRFLAVLMSFACAICASGFWGALAAAIRAFRGGHEVISSIMLNFLAAGLTSWFVVAFFQAPDSQNPEMRSIQDGFKLSRFSFFDGAPVTITIFLVLIFVFIFWVVLEKMSSGYRMKVIRQSPPAALLAGYNEKKIIFWSFTLGSCLCGAAGAVMVLGESWRFRLEMSDGFGFLGIAVALLGRAQPMGIVFSAFLFSVLHHGSSLLDIESSKIGRDLAQVIEALVVLSVVALPALMRSAIDGSIGLFRRSN